MNTAHASEIRRYLETGQYDERGGPWPGRTTAESMRNARMARRLALCQAVEERARQGTVAGPPPVEDAAALVRARVTPMVRGLFPAREQDVVLGLLERSLVVLTATNIRATLAEVPWDHTAWSLANLYLGGLGAPLLGPDAVGLLGLSEEARCYLAPHAVWAAEPFVDVVVHEAAHVFHNCKRRDVGLPATRTREWLLSIDYRKRETFAYACEAYSAILRDSQTAAERTARGRAFTGETAPRDDGVDADELVDVVREACAVRNGWTRILTRCAPPGQKRGPHAPVGWVEARNREHVDE